MSQVGEAIVRFRAESKMSQADMAKKLGISQAHVSRLEKGLVEVPPHLFAKIQKLIRLPVEAHKFNLILTQDSAWKFAHFFYPEKVCGDRVRINNKASQDKSWILHCDAEGSDIAAAKDADLLIASFDAILNSINFTGLSPETAYAALNKTIKTSKDLWRGEPSANLICVSKNGDKLDFINAGMPSPLFFESKKNQVSKLTNGTPTPPLGLANFKESMSSRVLYLKKEDVIFFCSDGFEELYKQTSKVSFETLFETVCKIQRGDVEGIGSKLLKTLEEQLMHQRIADDISFALASLV